MSKPKINQSTQEINGGQDISQDIKTSPRKNQNHLITVGSYTYNHHWVTLVLMGLNVGTQVVGSRWGWVTLLAMALLMIVSVFVIVCYSMYYDTIRDELQRFP